MMIDQAIQNSYEELKVQFLAGTPTTLTVDLYRVTKDADILIASGVSTVIGTYCTTVLIPTHNSVLGQYKAIWNAIIASGIVLHTQYYEVVRRKTRYCPEKDVRELLLDHDMPRGVDIGRFIYDSEDWLDEQLSGIYEVPMDMFTISVPDRTKAVINRVVANYAAGSILQGAAASSENEELHAYGKKLEQRALDSISKIKEGIVILTGVSKDQTPSDESKVSKIAHDSPDNLQNNGWFDDPDDIGPS